MFVKPKTGSQVRDPVTKRHLPSEGKEVPSTTYWVRRLADGDVVLAQRPQEMVLPSQETP